MPSRVTGKILNQGMMRYLSKPVDSRSLAEELDRLLSKRAGLDVSQNQASGTDPSGEVRAAREG
jgi:response regulator of citrate/malate metabolism